MSEPSWLTTARSLIGKVQDGATILPLAAKIGQTYPEMASYSSLVTPNTSWCGEFVAYCLTVNGIRPVFGSTDTTKFLWAMAWVGFGASVTTPQAGDVLVFDFGGGDHHVTFFVSDNGNGTWECLGGNQSDQVKISTYQASQCIAIRRPPVALPGTIASDVAAATPDRFSGKGSVFSWYTGKYVWTDDGDAPNSNALGVPDDQQGIALYSRATLGDWFNVTAPNGVTLKLQQTDIGPAPRTGRLIDIAAVAAERFGYSPSSFPTDGTFTWSPYEDTAMPDAPAIVTTIAPSDDTIKKVATELRKQLEDNPAVKQSVGTLATAGIAALVSVFPQFAIFGSLAQFFLANAGVMGTAVGDAATPTGQATGATFLALAGSWLVSKLNGVFQKPAVPK